MITDISIKNEGSSGTNSRTGYMLFRVLISALWVFTGMVSLSAIGVNYTPRELIVKTSEPLQTRGLSFEIPELDSFLAEMSVKEIKPVTPSLQNRFYVVRVEEDFEWENVRRRLERQEMRNSPHIEYIQPNYLSELLVAPNDPLFSQQYLDIMRLPQAWNYETGSEQIVVALIDSGLWFDHPEFACHTNIWINEAEYPPNGEDSSGNGYIDDWRGWNFVDAPELADIALGKFIGQDNEPFDESGHGTHVAGIVGAKTNNNEGIAGVCWNVKLMILRAGFRTTTGTGYLQDDDAAAAIIYAADNGAHVINVSWGSSTFSQIIADACQYAYERGTIIVASAGNTPQPKVMYPAKLNTTIAVGAIDNNLNLTGFSSYGPDLDIVAPGQNILSTYLEQDEEYYRRLSGTSMSAPYVAGAIALLLSHSPGLSFNEVTSRLFNSAVKLGTPGFNNRFGHGLLNVESLLLNTYSPYINVTYPLNNQGQSESFDIIGTVSADNFFRYSVMFTTEEEPVEIDWRHVNDPSGQGQNYYYSQVEDGVIARVNLNYTLPDADYLVRIKLETIENGIARSYEKRFRVNINKSIPSHKEEELMVTKRYQGVMPAYFVQAGFNQRVSLRIDFKEDDSVFADPDSLIAIYSNYSDSLHILRVPDVLAEQTYSLRLTAVNNSGLDYQSDWFHELLVIDKQAVPTDLFMVDLAGPPLISVGKSFDFSGNGVPEFIGLEINEDQSTGRVSVYELNQGRRMQVRHTFEEKFLPLDMGVPTQGGRDVFGMVLDSGVIWSTYGQNDYPTVPLWSKSDVVGGNFGDYNNDGKDEILLVRNYQNERVVSVFERVALEYEERNILRNTSPTETRNNFVPRVATADLTGNGYTNVLTADTDGDVMVYELYGADQDSLLYHYRLPVPNAYHPAIADFTGDGNLEFCVGGYSYLYTDPNKIFWHFQFFGFDKDASVFKPLGYVSFDHFESINSIKAIDLTGDGKSELVLAITPYLYVVSFEDGEFKPIWKGDSQSTYQVVPIAPNINTPVGVVVNALHEGNIFSHFVYGSSHQGPPSPTGLTANPLDESSIMLNWNQCTAERYIIHRKWKNEHEEWQNAVIDSIGTNSYKDSGLQSGTEYHYAVQAYSTDPSYDYAYSKMTPWSIVTPYNIPTLRSAKMSGRHEVSLLFDTQLSNDAVNLGYYNVNNGIGVPSSVNHTHNQRGLLLRFFDPLLEQREEYYVEINGLRGKSGVPFPSGKYGFEYVEDLQPPVVEGYSVTDKKELEIYFNKVINKEKAERKSNYDLRTPLIDPFNSIEVITCMDSVLTIIFKEELKISNQSYTIKMNNIEDLFGNLIRNNQNILKFRVTDVDNLDYVQVVPNPFVRNQPGHTSIKFVGLPLETEGHLYIYSLAGELIFGEQIRTLTESESEWIWNGYNNSRNRVSSGTYFYVIKMGKHITRGQLVIVN